MSEMIFIQNVSKKTYMKVFLIASGPIFVIFVWSLIDGKNTSFLYFFLSLLILNGVLLGSLKIAFPKRPALKIEGASFYIFNRGQWAQFNPSTNLFLKPGHVRILLNKRYLTVHFDENEYQRLLDVLDKTEKVL